MQAPELMEILELDSFDTAFAVKPGEESTAQRRFMTLFVDASDPGHAGSLGMVRRATNASGEVFAVKQLKLSSDEVSTLETSLTTDDLSPSASETLRIVRGRMAAFQEEYRIQLAFSHLKGFPRLYGMGLSHGQPCIVMEWVEGSTLSDVRGQLPRAQLAGVPIEPGDAAPVDRLTVARLGASLFQILSGVESLRERPAHRDLSPGNIMIRTRDTALSQQCASGNFDLCLIDFGSATFTDERSASFTMVSDIWRNGTPEYAPPEMLTRDIANVEQLRQSPSIDVYAACSILYELFAGHTPFRVAQNRESSPFRLKMDTVALPLACYNALEQELATIIMSGLAPVQADRPSAEDLVKRLEQWCAKATGSPQAAGVAASAAATTPPAAFAAAGATMPTTTPLSSQGAHLSALGKQNGGVRVGSKVPTSPLSSARREPEEATTPTAFLRRASAKNRPAVPLAVRNNKKRRQRAIIGSVLALVVIAAGVALVLSQLLG